MVCVSVIIPTYNRTTYLREALDSVVNQTYPVEEILVINDGSDVNCSREIKDICDSYPNVRLIVNAKVEGVSYSRNLGMSEANGDYLIFLDDDDTLAQSFVKRGVDALALKDVDSVIFKAAVHNSSNSRRGYLFKRLMSKRWRYFPSVSENTQEFFLIHCPMVHSFIFRKKSIQDFNFPIDLVYGEDMFLWLQLCGKIQFKFIDHTSSYARFHSDNSTSNLTYEAKKSFYEKTADMKVIRNKRARRIQAVRRLYFECYHGRLPALRTFWQAVQTPVFFLSYSWLNFSVRLRSVF